MFPVLQPVLPPLPVAPRRLVRCPYRPCTTLVQPVGRSSSFRRNVTFVVCGVSKSTKEKRKVKTLISVIWSHHLPQITVPQLESVRESPQPSHAFYNYNPNPPSHASSYNSDVSEGICGETISGFQTFHIDRPFQRPELDQKGSSCSHVSHMCSGDSPSSRPNYGHPRL